MAKTKRNRSTGKKLTLVLPEKYYVALQQLAAKEGVTRAVMARKIIKNYLADEVRKGTDALPDNQLSIFDGVQYDIFDAIKEAEKKACKRKN